MHPRAESRNGKEQPRASRRSSLPVGEAGIEPEPKRHPQPGFWSGAGTLAWKRPEVFHSLEVLIAAFELAHGPQGLRPHACSND